MGLNIYFCDVCGVRVTDVDLRSGHGMLRAQDVICATCLEMGHGKEWLANRGIGSEAMAMAGSAAARPAAPSSSASGAKAAALIDSARDRAVTLEDKAQPQPQQRSGSDSAQRRSSDLDDTKGVPVLGETDFSGAASGLAALATPTPLPTDMSDEESLEETSSGLDEGSAGHPDLRVAAAPRAGQTKTEEHPSSVFEPDDDDESSALVNVRDKAQSGSARSLHRGGRSDRMRKQTTSRSVPAASGGKASGKKPSTSGVKSVERGSSSGRVKASKGKSSTRSTRRANASRGMPMPLKISLITVPIILLIALIVLFSSGGSQSAGDVKDIRAQKERMDRSFSEAKSMVNQAVNSKGLEEMKTARERWHRFQEEWSQFTTDAKQYSNWTEENCDQYWESLRAHDVQGRLKILNDEIAKQSVGH